MAFKSDIEIAYEATMWPIQNIADKMGLAADDVDLHGKYIAKVQCAARGRHEPRARKILVTAMTPTPAGEGKTTVTIGLADALNRIGHKAVATIREPSLGPVFGVKGGAAGGGYSQVLPMEDINLHFTGDIHAVGATHNLLASLLDNRYTRVTSGVCLLPASLLWHRVVDMNDRALRDVVIGLGETAGQVRQSKYEITAASEIMAILALAFDLEDLKRRMGNVMVAESAEGEPMYAKDIQAQGAMAILMKDAVKPNLVQTIDHNPVLVHAGPFANIAHGTNSLIAMDIARRYADITVVEAGFGSDLGAEKFFNLVSRQKGAVPPDAVVIVATVRALKHHGGVARKKLDETDVAAVRAGFPNLQKHIENMQAFNRPVVVAVNSFFSDTTEELQTVVDLTETIGVPAHVIDVWGKGGAGAENLAAGVWESVQAACGPVAYTYELTDSLEDKMRQISQRIYGADDILLTRSVQRKLQKFTDWGYGHLPVCMAKTQSSLSDDPALLGRPTGFLVEIQDVKVCSGAGFVVVYTTDILTMPGLPKAPAADAMDIDPDGRIRGLF
ncbi:MAG: formate--tetrahydrofolate ligase [Acidobacteria bacterium]|nr:formate--tetrahydrofolate ligase [Acidobacteriota bacterium]